jgi:hypothetical protein
MANKFAIIKFMVSKNLDWDQKANRSRNRWFVITTLVVAIILAGVGYFGYRGWNNSKQIISPTLKNQLTFAFFWPSQTTSITAQKQSIKYDNSIKQISYIAQTVGGAHLTVSEQATPQSFTDVPQVYDKLMTSMFQYEAFDTVNGKVYLTHPKELNGGQAAVMNSKGTLLFIKPDKPLSDDTWHQVFNNLQII